MKKKLFALTLLLAASVFTQSLHAQTTKNKKSKYYQNSTKDPEFNVRGFETGSEKNEVSDKPKEREYDVEVTAKDQPAKYKREKKVWVEDDFDVPDSYFAPMTKKEKYKLLARKDREKQLKMTSRELEYMTTVVKKRYTNLDVLCDDLDLAKIQRPTFKGICTECDADVDRIITNKTLSSLEKNYQLKQCYMQRDKRLMETLDTDQYKKWLRIKDADEYLILSKDPELKDGIYK